MEPATQTEKPKRGRGRPRSYDFEGMEPYKPKEFPESNANTLITAAKAWAKSRGLDWAFKCFKVENVVTLIRVK